MISPKNLCNSAKGFTIVELLVAMAVFSVVLLVITGGILQISRVYYKGVTEANTQNTARSIMDLITQSIQFSGGDVSLTPTTINPGVSYAFCVGDQQYSYVLGYQLADSPNAVVHQANHALVVNTVAGCTGADAQDLRQPTVAGRELLNPKMRLTKLAVTDVGDNLYRVDLRIVYGDDDLLTDPTGATSACIKATAGTQYCSISDLSSVVTKRVQ